MAEQLEFAVNTLPPPREHVVSGTSRQVPVEGLQHAPLGAVAGQEPGQVPLGMKVPTKAQAPGTHPNGVQQTPAEVPVQVLEEQIPPTVQVPPSPRQLIWVSTEQVVPTQQDPVPALRHAEQLVPRPASVVLTGHVP